MITSKSKTLNESEYLMRDPAEKQIMSSMSNLLARAGLEYRGKFVETGGRRVHYLDYGEGSPVLLLHGGGAGSAIWFRQIEVLAKTRRVIVPDHPLFGLSSQIAYEAPWVEFGVDYLIGFMDSIGIDSADVVALSLGAQISLAMAIAEPTRVKKLVVIGSSGLGKEFPMLYKLANVPVVGRLIVRPNRWGQDTYFKTMEVADSEFADAEAYKQYAYDVTLTKGHAKAMRSSIGILTSFDGQKAIFTDEELSSVRQPVLAVWGEEDPLFPVEHGYRLTRLVPDLSMHVIDGARHVPLLDNPDTVNALIAGFIAGS